MNTRFLVSPAYLLSIFLMVVGALLSRGRFMLLGWILFIVGACLNALTMVLLVNREQLQRVRSEHRAAKGSASEVEIPKDTDTTVAKESDKAQPKDDLQSGSEENAPEDAAPEIEQQDTAEPAEATVRASHQDKAQDIADEQTVSDEPVQDEEISAEAPEPEQEATDIENASQVEGTIEDKDTADTETTADESATIEDSPHNSAADEEIAASNTTGGDGQPEAEDAKAEEDTEEPDGDTAESEVKSPEAVVASSASVAEPDTEQKPRKKDREKAGRTKKNRKHGKSKKARKKAKK